MTDHNTKKFNTYEVAWKCAALKWNRSVLSSFIFFLAAIYKSLKSEQFYLSLQKIHLYGSYSFRRERAILESGARTLPIQNKGWNFFLVIFTPISDQLISEGRFLSLYHFISTNFYDLPSMYKALHISIE